MKSGKKIFYTLVLFFSTIFYGCSDILSPDEVDPRLIGEWYYTVNSSSTNPSPKTYFFGMQITADKNVKSLGIETKTGKVAILNNSNKKIKKAYSGEFIWEVIYIDIGPVTEFYTYRFENEKLILSRQNQNDIYTKTNLGTQLFEPMISNFSVKVDTIFYENKKISHYPSAYVSNISDFFLLSAEMDHASLRIELNNFNGIGSYVIPYNKIEFVQHYSDYGIIYVPDSLSTGNITITQYDSVCSGTFYVNEPIPDNPDSIIIAFKEGIFTVPIYK